MPSDSSFRENHPIPNDTLYGLLTAMEAVIDPKAFRQLLTHQNLQHYIGNYPPNNTKKEVTFADYAALQHAVEHYYDRNTARAILIEVGRTMLRHDIATQTPVIKIAQMALTLLPQLARAKMILNRLVETDNNQHQREATLEENEQSFILTYRICPGLYRPKTEATTGCPITIGIIQEAIVWATGGKYHAVRQHTCRVFGDPTCSFEVAKFASE